MLKNIKELILLSEKGFKLIPCKGKKPCIKEWQKKATNNIDIIKSTWKDDITNVAILTGNDGGGIIVIDCDVKENINGINNFYDYLSKNNIELPETLTARSGSGGMHFYFKTNIKINSSVSKYIECVDIRGEGGCVIAPPSVHPNGNKYKWENDCEIAYLPEKLEKLFTSNTLKNNKEKKKDLNKNNLEIIYKGERNNTLFRTSCKLIKTGLQKDTILEILKLENTRCEEPLDDEELTKIVNSSLRYREDIIGNLSTSKIFSGKYNTTAIAIYWYIWYSSLNLLNDTIYVSQKEICKYLKLKTPKTISDNIKLLKNDDLIKVDKAPNKKKGKFSVNCYSIL